MKYNHFKIIFLLSMIICLIVFLTILLTVNPNKIIPIHFNLAGNVTKTGTTKDVFQLFFVNIIILVILFILSNNPSKLNYPMEINEDNKVILFGRMQLFLSITGLVATIIFSIIALASTHWVVFYNSYTAAIVYIAFSLLIPTILFFLLKRPT